MGCLSDQTEDRPRPDYSTIDRFGRSKLLIPLQLDVSFGEDEDNGHANIAVHPPARSTLRSSIEVRDRCPPS
jgi:hypothetical protein